MTKNKKTVEKYIDGFNKLDHTQILSCLTDDIEWTVFGAFHLKGKEAYDKEIENDNFVGRPVVTITRMIEENNVVMAEATLSVEKKNGGFMRAALSEVFVMEDGLIKERRAYVVELKKNHIL